MATLVFQQNRKMDIHFHYHLHYHVHYQIIILAQKFVSNLQIAQIAANLQTEKNITNTQFPDCAIQQCIVKHVLNHLIDLVSMKMFAFGGSKVNVIGVFLLWRTKMSIVESMRIRNILEIMTKHCMKIHLKTMITLCAIAQKIEITTL